MTSVRDPSREPDRKHLAEARRLITSCTADMHDAGSIADAVESMCGKVTDHLEPLIGGQAARALLARAVYLSRPRFPLLNPVSTAEVDIASVARETALQLRRAEAAQALEVATAVFGYFVWLLTRFIGEDLGPRLLREACPDLGEEQQ